MGRVHFGPFMYDKKVNCRHAYDKHTSLVRKCHFLCCFLSFFSCLKVISNVKDQIDPMMMYPEHW